MGDPLRPTPIAALLRSASADSRVEALDRLADEGDWTLAPVAVELLEDDAPFVFLHGDAPMIAEVRSRALVTVERLYRLAKRDPDFGAVRVRRAMPAAVALTRAAALLDDADDAAALRAAANDDLDARVQPPHPYRDAALAYRVLQRADAVPYRTETVDPTDWLTPLQREVSASQTRGNRPTPHLCVQSPEDGRDLGFLYRLDDRWTLDFAEDASALEARNWIRLVLTTIERDGVPRVAFDDAGQARVSEDGSFVLDGVISHDTDAPESLLRSVQAFADRRYRSTLHP